MNLTSIDPASSVTGGCSAWARLHDERGSICEALLAEDCSIRSLETSGQESDLASEDTVRDLEWKRRESLQMRLRQIDDALDRVFSGSYGHCVDCGKTIDVNRLVADAAVSGCVACQRKDEGEAFFHSI